MTRETESDDLGQEHVDRLADHHGLCLDPTYPPADDAQAVDHRRVTVRTDQRIRIQSTALVPHDLGEVFEIDLVNDPGGWWNNGEVVEGRLTPFQEFVAFLVPLELVVRVDAESIR